MCKLDLEKAYDRVDWGFLSYLMHHTGFGDKRCHWVMESVSSAKLSILINGSPKGFFSTQRGLHQGNPLSLLLFAIVGEALSRMVATAREANLINLIQANH